MEPSGLCNIPASAFLRPLSAPSTEALRPLQEGRIVKALRDAAARGRIVHLWWHPQNFVAHPDENLERLQVRLLDELDRLRATDGMRSLSMADVCDSLRAGHRAAYTAAGPAPSSPRSAAQVPVIEVNGTAPDGGVGSTFAPHSP